MEGVNVLGRVMTKDTGETVAELFGPPNAFSNEHDVLSQCLYYLSEIIIRGLQPDKRGGFLGGEFGYGADYENPIFLMNPDYQDAECDCGIDKLGEKWHQHGGCVKTCFSRRCLKARTDAKRPYRAIIDWLVWERNQFPPFDDSKAQKELQRHIESFSDMERSAENKAQRDLAQSMGVKGRDAWACTCGGKGRWAEWRELHPHTERCAIMLPNFWHKPSGLKITWYKWIGRDMKMEPSSVDGQQWGALFHECLDSLPADAVAKAKTAHEDEQRERNKPEYKEAQTQGMRRMMEVMMSPEKHGAPPEKRVCRTCGKKEDGPPSWTTPMFWKCDECRGKLGATLRRKALKAARTLGITLPTSNPDGR